MKFLFLDFDGVLNSRLYFQRMEGQIPDEDYICRRAQMIDPEAVSRLNRIIDVTNARIIVSSSWRIDPVEELQKVLEQRGFKHRLHGRTPNGSEMWEAGVSTPGRAWRGHEIDAWMTKGVGLWLEEGPRTVKSFVILDDDSDMVHLMDRLVRTDYSIGLTDVDADHAIKMLEG